MRTYSKSTCNRVHLRHVKLFYVVTCELQVQYLLLVNLKYQIVSVIFVNKCNVLLYHTTERNIQSNDHNLAIFKSLVINVQHQELVCFAQNPGPFPKGQGHT